MKKLPQAGISFSDLTKVYEQKGFIGHGNLYQISKETINLVKPKRQKF
jgi:hypothetical protein